MDLLACLAVGVLVAAAVYLFLARDLPRALVGFLLLGTAANLTVFASGRLGPMTPPLVEPGAAALGAAANPLPQALVLTAIVIGFGLATFTLMLILKSHAVLGTASSDEMNEAEPVEDHALAAAPAVRQEAA